MKSLRYFKIRFRLASPLGTPLAADTLFGHLCWSLVYGDNGENKLREFLDAMSGESPPLLLSDPFPSGMLPIPVLPSAPQMPTLEPDTIKNLRKRTLMTTESFLACCGNLSPTGLLQTLAKADEPFASTETTLVPHNHVDRLGGGTIEGGIFFHEDEFPKKENVYDMYVASPIDEANPIKEKLSKATEGGYGRDKSTGRGVIDWLEIEPWTPPTVSHPNAVMLLGPCAPATDDPTDGYWKIKAKAGRLGGHWAIDKNPFKKTMMMLQAGSVLLTETPKDFYGRMVENAHSDPELGVRHYGLALALPIHLVSTEGRDV